MSDNKDFYASLYKMFVVGKKSFQTYEMNEIEERIKTLEGIIE